MKTSLLYLLLISFSGCVSLDTIQTGRTLGKDKMSLSGSLSHGLSEDIGYFSLFENGSYFFGQTRYMYGVGEKLDLGATVNMASFVIINSKYQVTGTKNSAFASSIGLDVGATPVTLLHALTLGYMASVRSYNTFFIGEKLGLTISPAYVFLGNSQFSDGYGGSYTNLNNYLGYSVNAFYGDKEKLFIEVSNFETINNFNFSVKPTISIGYCINLN
jgi:hypothetical protein